MKLWRDYDANEVLADETYKDKKLLVTGRVKSIDKDFLNDIVLQLQSPNEFMSTHATLEDSEKAAAAQLRKGATVTLECIGRGLVIGSPMLDDCRLR